jgi:outer membrane biosynthesis protein TonB
MPQKDTGSEEKRMKVKIVEEAEEEVDKDKAIPETEEKPEEETSEKKQEVDKAKPEVESETDQNKPPSDKIPFWILFIAFLMGLALGAGLIGGIFYYRTKVENAPPNQEKQLPSSQIEDTSQNSSPTPQAQEENNLSSYSVEILNGSGIKGEAGKVEGLLSDAGFSDTTASNASSYDYTDTQVALKAAVPDEVFTKIEETLSTYKIKRVDDLGDSSKYDVVITVGSSKN